MRLSKHIWKISVLFIVIAAILKILNSSGYILSIQSYLDPSIITLFLCIGIVVIYVYSMVLSTRGFRIIITISFVFILFIFSSGFFNTSHELLENEDHQIIVEITDTSEAFTYYSHGPETMRTISFYENDSLLLSKKIAQYYFFRDSPFQYTIINDQLIIYRESDPNYIYEIIDLN